MFNQYKQDTNFRASIPIPQIKQLVETSLDYSQFQENRSKYLKKVNYAGSYEQAYQQLTIATAPIAYSYWADCMRSCATRRIGLFAWKEREDRESVVVRVYYHGAPEGPNRPVLRGGLLGGSVDGAAQGQLFPANTTIPKNGEESVIIRRQPGQNVTATISAAGLAVSPPIYATWLDKLPPPVETSGPPVYELTPGGFTPTNGGNDRATRHPGCSCGPAEMTVEPLTQNVTKGEYATFKWDGTWICRGQSIKDAGGTVWFDGQTAARLPDSYGVAKVKYDAKHSQLIQLEFSGTCYDNCENHCTTRGTLTINVE